MFGGSLGAFFAVLAALGFQAQAPAEQPAPRQVVVRRVIKTVVVHHDSPVRSPSPAAAQAAPATTPAPTPLTTQSS